MHITTVPPGSVAIRRAFFEAAACSLQPATKAPRVGASIRLRTLSNRTLLPPSVAPPWVGRPAAVINRETRGLPCIPARVGGAAAQPPSLSARLAECQAQLQQETAVLERVKRPGYWNGATADMFSQIITRTDMWPAGRFLRIIDCARDTITLIGPDGTMKTHHGRSAERLLPEPTADEVILMRAGAHYVRISPDEKVVVRDVPADGDCFFSCISDSFGVPEAQREAHNQLLRNSIARLLASDPHLMMVACVSDDADVARPPSLRR